MLPSLILGGVLLFFKCHASDCFLTNPVAAIVVCYSSVADAMLAQAYRTDRRWCRMLLSSGACVGPLMLQAFEENPDRSMFGFLLGAYEGSDGYFRLLKLLPRRRISDVIDLEGTPLRFRQVMDGVISMEHLIDAACMDNVDFAMRILDSVETVNLEVVYEAIRHAEICRASHFILKRVPTNSWIVLNRIACESANLPALVLLVMRDNPLGLLRKLDGLMFQWNVDAGKVEQLLNLALEIDNSFAPQLIGMSACMSYFDYGPFDRLFHQWIDHLTMEQLEKLRTLLFLRVGGEAIALIDQRLQR